MKILVNKTALITTIAVGASVIIIWVLSNFRWNEGEITYKLSPLGEIIIIGILLFMVYIILSYYHSKHLEDCKFDFRIENNNLQLWCLIKSNMKKDIITGPLSLEYADTRSVVLHTERRLEKTVFNFKNWKQFGKYMEKKIYVFNFDDIKKYHQIGIILDYRSDWERDSIFDILIIPSGHERKNTLKNMK